MRYTTPSDPSTLDPKALADTLEIALDRGYTQLLTLTDEDATKALAPGKWSAQQVIGHLCDSAMNNQQRVVRLALEPTLELPGYEQEGWVRVQAYALRPWAEVLALWLVLNRHLGHTVRHLERAALTHIWMHGGEPLTLGFIIEDYIAHLEHHLRALPKSAVAAGRP